MKTVKINVLKRVAHLLIDDGSNKEYTRGICELIADVDGIEDMPLEERAEQVANELGTTLEVVF